MGNMDAEAEYYKLDSKGRLFLSKKHREFLGVRAGQYVVIWTLDTERALGIEKASDRRAK